MKDGNRKKLFSRNNREPITIDQFEQDRIVRATQVLKRPSPYIEILKNRNFLFLWLGQSISNTGDWLIVVPLVLMVEEISGSATAVGALMIFKILPALLFSSAVGVLADRLNRKRSMIFCDLARSFLVLLLLFARSLYQIYIVVFAMDTLSLLFMPVKDATIPNIVDNDRILTANSLSFTTNQVTMILGLVIGSTIVSLVGAVSSFLKLEQILYELPVLSLFAPKLVEPQAAFLLDAVTFLLSAATITLIHVPVSKHALSKIKVGQLKEDIVEGYRFLKQHQQVRSMLMSVGIAILGAGAIYTLGAFFCKEVLGVGAAGIGPLLIGLAFGLLFGALASGSLTRFVAKDRSFVLSILIFGVALILFASLPYFWLAIVLAVVAGFGLGTLTVVGYTFLQETVSDKMRGRVFTALESILRISLFASLVVTGLVADLIGQRAISLAGYAVEVNGSQATLFLGGVVVVLAGVFGYHSMSQEEVADG